MKIQQFGGGLNTRLAPQMLQVNQGTVYNNIDSTTNLLEPVKKHLSTAQFVGSNPQWFEADEEWLSSTDKRTYVEFQSKIYWTDGVAPKKRKNGVTDNLGIVKPADFTSTVATVQLDPVKNFTTISSDSTVGVGTPLEINYYVLVNTDATSQSDLLYFSVDLNGNVQLRGSNLIEVPSQISNKKVKIPDITDYDPALTRLVTIGEIEGLVFGVNGVKLFRLYKDEFHLVGSLFTDTGLLEDTVLDISGNEQLVAGSFGPVRGIITYAYTYYNSVDGAESAPSALSEELDLTNGGTVTLTMTASPDTQVDKIRIYRLGNNLTNFSLVEEISGTTIVYIDDTKDTEIDASILDTTGSAEAPDDILYLTEAYAMLFAAQGSSLRFTPIGQPNSWPPLFFLAFDSDITSIANVTAGLLVMTKFKTHLVTGTGPTTLAQDILSSDQGNISHESTQVIEGTAIWASTDGICSSSGSTVAVISKTELGKITLSPIDSVVHDETYYLLESSGSALLLDLRFGKIFKRASLQVASLAVANDILYGSVGIELVELFGSTEYDTMNYKSPRFIEGKISENKTYKKVFIYCEGDIILKILIDSELVTTRTLSTTDGHQIQVPQEKQRGFYIEFEVEGTGTVHEIEYEATLKHV